ncbi:MAG: DUF2330 domain-containing protein [bacterium]
MKKNILLIIVMSLTLLLIGITMAGADRGSIPFIPNIQIYEPLQRAIIAWNGEEQILILSTDLYSSQPVKVLEVLPLPSEPEIKEGDMEVFEQINKLIHKKIWQDITRPGFRSEGRSTEQEAGEITFHEQIGAHDITVTNVIRSDEFISWANDYLKSLGVDTPTIPEDMEEVIAEYLADGYNWFVFDVVELDKNTKTNQAIQYQFKTDELFFPMRITRTEEGETEVNLQAIMPRLKPEVKGLRLREINPSVIATRNEIKNIDDDIYQMFNNQEQLVIHSWLFRGQLNSFTDDIRIGLDEPEEDVYSYRGQLYSNCQKRETDSDILDKEDKVLCGNIEEISPQDNLFYKGAILDGKILIDAYSNKPLKNYYLLLDEKKTIHGYSGNIELTLKDFQSSILENIRLQPEDEKKVNEKINFKSVFFVTRIEDWKYICGQPYLFDRYNIRGDFCFWHPEGPGVDITVPPTQEKRE